MTVDSKKQLAKYIDHTLLNATAVTADIERLCAEAVEHGFCAVCVLPRWTSLAADILRGTKVGQEIERQADTERASERRELAEQIAELRKRRKAGPPPHPGHVEGFRLYAEAAQEAQHRISLDTQIGNCERRLRELADPLIFEFIEEMSVMQEEERRTQILEESEMERAPLGDLRSVAVASTYASLGERLEAIRLSIEAAEALKLNVGIDVEKELQKLRDGLPQLQMRRLE